MKRTTYMAQRAIRITSIISAMIALFCAFCTPSQAQVPVALMPDPRPQFFLPNGTPNAGGCLFFFAAGTSTPAPTYTDSSGQFLNTNPLILDSSGYATVYLANSSYKIVEYSSGGTNCAAGIQIWSADNVNAFQIVNGSQTIIFAGVTSYPSGSLGEVVYRTDLGSLCLFNSAWGCLANLNSNNVFAGLTTLNGGTFNGNYAGSPNFSAGATGTYFGSSSANSAASGVFRLASADVGPCWRNNLNSADLCISKNTNDQFSFPTAFLAIPPIIGNQTPNTIYTSTLNVTGPIAEINGVPTSGPNGVPGIFGLSNNTAQVANITNQSLVAVPTSGLYRVSCYEIVTTPGTVSSTLPNCVINYTDEDNNVAQTVTVATGGGGNTTTTLAQGTAVINAKSTSAITFSTTGYATSGATTMQYAVRVRVEGI